MSGLDGTEQVQSSVKILIYFPVFAGGKSNSGSVAATQVVSPPEGGDTLPSQSAHQSDPSLAEIFRIIRKPRRQ